MTPGLHESDTWKVHYNGKRENDPDIDLSCLCVERLLRNVYKCVHMYVCERGCIYKLGCLSVCICQKAFVTV